jgi:molecular chaperone HtpG
MAKDDDDKYQKFWDQFGQVIKEGPAEDHANKDKIAGLLRFATTKGDGAVQNVSLQTYLQRMVEGQEKIYYLVADSHAAASQSPLLEAYKKRDIEVLLLSDRVDEWLVGHLTEFEGKSLHAISKGEVDLPGEDQEDEVSKEEKAKQADEYATVLEQMKKALADQVAEVRLTDRLTDSPACVVFAEHEMSGHMQRLMEAAGQSFDKPKPTLELNPDHPLLHKVKAETDDECFGQWSEVLLNQALLAEGEQLPNPAHYVKQLNALLLR